MSGGGSCLLSTLTNAISRACFKGNAISRACFKGERSLFPQIMVNQFVCGKDRNSRRFDVMQTVFSAS